MLNLDSEMEMGQFICELHEERVERERKLELEEDDLYSSSFSDYSDYSDDEASAEDSEEDDRGVYLFRKPNFQLSHILA